MFADKKRNLCKEETVHWPNLIKEETESDCKPLTKIQCILPDQLHLLNCFRAMCYFSDRIFMKLINIVDSLI